MALGGGNLPNTRKMLAHYLSPPIPTGTNMSTIPGDANMDFEVNIFDILAVRDHIFGITLLKGQAFANADVAEEFGVLNIFDILGIRDIIFGVR